MASRKWHALAAIMVILGLWYQSRECNVGYVHTKNKMMRAISYRQWGSPDMLEMSDIPVPDFGE